jgi:hypothetical protein
VSTFDEEKKTWTNRNTREEKKKESIPTEQTTRLIFHAEKEGAKKPTKTST